MKFLRNHKLPAFPPSVAPLFRSLQETLSLEAIEELRDTLATKVEEMLIDADTNDHLDPTMIRSLYERSLFLLNSYESRNTQERALIVGAVRYFFSDSDPIPDHAFATGLDDDIKVMNHVLEELGIEDKFIKL